SQMASAGRFPGRGCSGVLRTSSCLDSFFRTVPYGEAVACQGGLKSGEIDGFGAVDRQQVVGKPGVAERFNVGGGDLNLDRVFFGQLGRNRGVDRISFADDLEQ